MERRQRKFLLLGVGIVATMGILLAVAVSQPDGLHYYLTVGEFLDSAAERSDGFRVNGKVVTGSIERLSSGEDVRFVITDTDGERTLPVSYHGIIPDTFVDGADVVVQGGLRDDGTFDANLLLAKCPSKYEAADGAEEPRDETPPPTQRAANE